MSASDDEGVRERSGAAAKSEPQRASGAEIHKLIELANRLYKHKRYREAKATCRQLAALDPSVFVPEQMIEACDREIRKRRAIVLGGLVALTVGSAAAIALYLHLARVRVRPPPGTVRLAEGEACHFAIRCALGRHRALEYTWTMLDASGEPIPAPEQSCLKLEWNSPWACTYTPSTAVASAKPGANPTRRSLTATAVDASGNETLRYQWTLEVTDVPQAPAILAREPESHVPVSLTTGQQARFRVEAVDGDGAAKLTYEWQIGGCFQPGATGPTWTYTPDPKAIARATPKLDAKGTVLRSISCLVANRFGQPLTQIASWQVLVTPADAP